MCNHTHESVVSECVNLFPSGIEAGRASLSCLCLIRRYGTDSNPGRDANQDSGVPPPFDRLVQFYSSILQGSQHMYLLCSFSRNQESMFSCWHHQMRTIIPRIQCLLSLLNFQFYFSQWHCAVIERDNEWGFEGRK